MKRLFAVAVLAVFLSGVVPAYADDSVHTTVPTEFISSSPLQISKYKRSNDGTHLDFFQLFNNGDVPLDLNEWRVVVQVEGRSLLPPGIMGYLAPHEHVIVSTPGVVAGATLALPEPLVSTAQILIVPPSGSGFSTDTYALKFTKVGSAFVYDEVWRRTSTTTGYSSSLTSFNTVAETQHFDDGLYIPPVAPLVRIVEVYPYASDCAPNDTSTLCGDYVKLYNPASQTVVLDDIVLRSDSSSANRTTANTFHLDGITLGPGAYGTVWLTDDEARISLTNSGGYVWLEDKWGLQRYDETITHYESAGINEQGYAWAQTDDSTWRWTSRPNPVGANEFPVVLATSTPEKLVECPVGKYRNPETNRCRSIEEAVNELATCEEGKERNPVTNRCRSVSTASAILAPCDQGQERNPATNRCRSVLAAAASNALAPCQAGYERNPSTNRCRKIATSPPIATPAAIDQSGDSPMTMALLVTAGLGAAGYGVYEWRSEIWRGLRRVTQTVGRK